MGISFEEFSLCRESSRRHLAVRLAQLRQQHDLTQAQVSGDLDITIGQYGAYEERRSEPPIYLIVRIAKYYKLTIDEFLQID